MPPAVDLLNYISSGLLWRIFSKLEFSRSFLYISLISQDTPPYCGFLRFFSIYYSPERSAKLRCTVYLEYQCVCSSSELVPPPLIRKLVCLPPWTQTGGATLSCRWGVGDPIRPTAYKAWHSVYSLVSVVELKEKPFTRAARVWYIIYFWNMNKKQRSCDG